MPLFIDVNYWAIFAAAVVQMLVDVIWYSQLVFGKQWMALAGISDDQGEEFKKKTNRGLIIGFVGSLITAYVFAHIIVFMLVNSIAAALTTAFWLWLGFVAARTVNMVAWEGKSWKLFFLHVGYDLVALCVMAVILMLWA